MKVTVGAVTVWRTAADLSRCGNK